MNFYKRFIGDIQKKTGHLSMAEFGAYDRLLDHYYALEQPLPLLAIDCYRICRAMVKAERDAVDRVLREFFQRTDHGYVHDRADEEIARYHVIKEAATAFWRNLPAAVKTEIAKARRKALVDACPAWLSEDEHAEIEAIYVEARRITAETGVPHQVDHIVPLRGKTVCGLHVPWNLQVLTAIQNRAKGRTLQ